MTREEWKQYRNSLQKPTQTISLDTWTKYRDILKKLSDKAADEFRDAVWNINGRWKGVGLGLIPRDDLIEFAYALVAKYGEGTAAVACELYDEMARLSGVNLAPAVPAELPTINEVGKAINGTIKQSVNENMVSGTVGRLVKQVGQDTTVRNAIRDGAQFAWIPTGDTCAFCITLASRGWQYASKKALKNGHAEHIHANCDCAYAVRFNDRTQIEGYDPDEYLRMYQDADGKTPQQKINAMRRGFYAQNKDIVGAESSIADELIPRAKNRTEAYSLIETMFGSISDNVKSLDDSLLVENVNRLNELNSRFKAIDSDNTGYFTASPSGKALAWTSSQYRDGKQNVNLSLVGKYYKDVDAVTSEATRGRETFYSMPFADENIRVYTITHEYGHILESRIIYNRADLVAFNEKVNNYNPALKAKEYRKLEEKEAKAILNEIIDIAKQKNPNFSLDESLSKYGHTNSFEFFAEVFANSQCGSPNELGEVMNEWLKREGF